MNEMNEYKIEPFHKQFKTACEYRGMTFDALSIELDISEHWAVLIRTGEVIPDIKTMLLLANILQMDLCYFFLPDAQPHHFDLRHFSDV